MSIDASSSSPAPRVRRSFGRVVASTVAALALVCAGLGLVVLSQPMRVTVTTPEPADFTTGAHASLTVSANQQLRAVPLSNVRISPNAGISITSTAHTLTVSFDETLPYSTEFHVEIDGIAGSFDGEARTVQARFTTPEATTVTVRRGDTGDRLVEREVGSGEERVLVERPHIAEFAVGGDRVLFSTVGDDKRNALELLDLATAEITSISLPAPGFVGQLDALPSSDLFGFRFGAASGDAEYSLERSLYTIEGKGSLRRVGGLGEEPLAVDDWSFLPGKPALVAQTTQGEMLLVDLRQGRQPVPLGSYTEIVSLSQDGSRVVLGDALGFSLYDLTRGSVEPIDFGTVDGEVPYASDAIELSSERGYLRGFQIVNPTSHQFEQRVTLTHNGETKTLYTADKDAPQITGLTVSSNEQYLAVESAAYSGGGSDNSVIIVDLGTGERVETFTGSEPRWLSSP